VARKANCMKSTTKPSTSASFHAPTPAEPIFPDPIPTVIPFGTLNFLAGASGAGKSRMLAAWWDRWQRGATINGYPTNPPTGLYWIFADRGWLEDGAEIMRQYGRTAQDVPHYNLADQKIPPVKRTPGEALNLLRLALDTLQPVRGATVYVDPAAPLFINGSINDPRAVAWSLFEYRRICIERQITLICTAYNVKKRTGTEDQYERPIDRLAGSGVFAGYSHTMMYIEEPCAERLSYRFGWRPRHAPEQEWEFEMDEAGRLVPYQGLNAEHSDAKYDRPTQLFLLIPEGEDGIDTSDLITLAFERLNIKKSAVYQDLRKLEDRRLIRTTPGHVWRRKPS